MTPKRLRADNKHKNGHERKSEGKTTDFRAFSCLFAAYTASVKINRKTNSKLLHVIAKDPIGILDR